MRILISNKVSVKLCKKLSPVRTCSSHEVLEECDARYREREREKESKREREKEKERESKRERERVRVNVKDSVSVCMSVHVCIYIFIFSMQKSPTIKCPIFKTNKNNSSCRAKNTQRKFRGMSHAMVALRPLMWEICCDVYTSLKATYEAVHDDKAYFKVHRFEFEK